MVTAILFLFGVIFGSFINALVWRLRKLETTKGKVGKKYSIAHGRSICVHCEHELAPKDLVPLFSWLALRGKCRYCQKPISAQYPIVELLTGILFAMSFAFWQFPLGSIASVAVLLIWLGSLVILIALAIYDIHWYELPDRLVFPMIGLGLVFAALSAYDQRDLTVLVGSLFGSALMFSLFWILFQMSKGEWIGGGDVKIAFALGAFAGGATESLLVIFIASLLGTLLAVPSLLKAGAIKGVKIPFGPYLITATILVVLFGNSVISWYQNLFALS